MRRMVSLIVMAIVVATLSSCGKEDKAAAPVATAAPTSAAAANGQVAVTVADFKVGLVQHTLPPGKVTFTVVGAGPSTHELVLFRTDLEPTKLPTNAEGTEVDEEGQGVQHIDEVEDVKAGTTKQLTVDLTPGSYVLLCNLAGHYKLGMETGLTVA